MLEMDSPKWKGERERDSDSDGIEDERRKVKEEQERRRSKRRGKQKTRQKGGEVSRNSVSISRSRSGGSSGSGRSKIPRQATRRLVKMLLGVSDARTARLIGDQRLKRNDPYIGILFPSLGRRRLTILALFRPGVPRVYVSEPSRWRTKRACNVSS